MGYGARCVSYCDGSDRGSWFVHTREMRLGSSVVTRGQKSNRPAGRQSSGPPARRYGRGGLGGVEESCIRAKMGVGEKMFSDCMTNSRHAPGERWDGDGRK
jgi:hypothetical protein